MNANQILKRVSEVSKLREAGLTEDEIRELTDMQEDQEARAEERAAEIENLEEFSRLKEKEESGLLNEDEQ